MFDENQLIETKCHPKTKKYYLDKGYSYTKKGDVFFVKAKDLPKNSHECIKVICDYCGEAYYPIASNYNNRKNKEFDACDKCRTLKGRDSTLWQRKNNTFNKLNNICKQNDYILLTDESEYKNGYSTIVYQCKKHGVQYSNAEMMLSGRLCKECGYEIAAKKTTLSSEHVKNKIEAFNGNKLLNAEEYAGARVRNLNILCACGNVYTTCFNDYMNRDSAKRCPVCSGKISSGEFAVKQVLENHHINFIQQKTFDGCKDKNLLPFDFYLPDYNMMIEYDGKQHYEPVEYFGGKESFDYTVRHDAIKNEYCKDNNIDILRIPYWYEDNIESIITKKLNL